MKTETHNITLAKAREWLEANLPYQRGSEGTNRPVSQRKVNQYAADMLAGNWRLTHQGIGFSTKGLLKDGQHRLLAIVQAAEEGATEGELKLDANPKIHIPMQVTWGLDDDVFEVLDTGLPRSASQILAIAGYANQTNLAAAARLLYFYDNHDYKFWRSVKVSNHEVLQVVQKTNIDAYIPEVTPLKPIGFIIPATAVGYFVCERAFPTGPHAEFIEALQTGENMAKTDPRMVLRNYAIRSKGQPKVRRDANLHLALYILTWNDFIDGKSRSAISWRSAMEFPKPIER